MDTIDTRAAVPADADVVADYHRRCFEATFAELIRAGSALPPDRGGTRQQFSEWFRPDSDVETQVVAIDGVPIAHVSTSENRLLNLFVDPQHQGHGIGRHLLALAESKLSDCGHHELQLHARVENRAAIGFYEHFGWTRSGRTIRTVEHGIAYDELVMVKNID